MSLLYVFHGIGNGGDYTVALDLFETLRDRGVVEKMFAVCTDGMWDDGKRLIPGRAAQRGIEVCAMPSWSQLKAEVAKAGIRPTLAHIHTGADVPRLSDIIRFKRGFPTLKSVWTVHGPANITPEYARGYRFRFWLGGRMVSRIIVPSIHKLEQWQRLGVYGNRIVRIPNPIKERSRQDKASARETLGLPAHARIAAFIGLLREAKRPGDLLDAAALLKEREPDLLCVFAGEGPLEQEMKDLAKTRDVDARFLGFVTDVVPVYSAADVFVFPSEYDNFPISLFEGVAFGIPTVCSAIPPTLNELDGCPGIYRYPVGSVPQMADQLSQALRDGDGAKDEMRKFVLDRYSADKVASQHVDLYRSLGF